MIYYATPVQEVVGHRLLNQTGIRLLIKREDLNHPHISGNKWWKLKHNLLEAQKQKLSTLLTFGGAYSNHIYATAAAADESGFQSIGIVRGEETRPLNPVMQFASERRMHIEYISRSEYRYKTDPGFIRQLLERFGAFYLIPEGGSNVQAVRGCAEFAEQEISKTGFDHLFLPVGTGGTMAGIICGLKDKANIAGVPVLKNGGFLADDIKRLAFEFSGEEYHRWSLLTSYHHGGYAKVTAELLSFIQEMKSVYNVPLDRVYTAKALWALMKEVESGSFKRGETILFLHTGGLHAQEPQAGNPKIP